MIYILITLAVFFLDYNIKNYIEQRFSVGEKKDILKGKITIKKQYNQGLCLNFLDKKAELVKKLSAVVFGALVITYIIVLPQKNKNLKKLGLSLCTGGAASNVWDRFKRGYVVDYFSINIKPIKNIIFNLADIFILLGSFVTFFTCLITGSKKSYMENISQCSEK